MLWRETALVLEDESHKPVSQALTRHPENDVTCVTAFLPASILSEFVLEHREGGTTFFSWMFPSTQKVKCQLLFV